MQAARAAHTGLARQRSESTSAGEAAARVPPLRTASPVPRSPQHASNAPRISCERRGSTSCRDALASQLDPLVSVLNGHGPAVAGVREALPPWARGPRAEAAASRSCRRRCSPRSGPCRGRRTPAGRTAQTWRASVAATETSQPPLTARVLRGRRSGRRRWLRAPWPESGWFARAAAQPWLRSPKAIDHRVPSRNSMDVSRRRTCQVWPPSTLPITRSGEPQTQRAQARPARGDVGARPAAAGQGEGDADQLLPRRRRRAGMRRPAARAPARLPEPGGCLNCAPVLPNAPRISCERAGLP